MSDKESLKDFLGKVRETDDISEEDKKRILKAMSEAHEFTKKLAKFVVKAGRKRGLSPAQITVSLCESFVAAAKSSKCPEMSLIGMFCKFAGDYYPNVAFQMKEQIEGELGVSVAGKEFTETVH